MNVCLLKINKLGEWSHTYTCFYERKQHYHVDKHCDFGDMHTNMNSVVVWNSIMATWGYIEWSGSWWGRNKGPGGGWDAKQVEVDVGKQKQLE